VGAIYEVDFLGFSYGFRPGRNPHRALDALAVGIQTKNVNWVLDADVREFSGVLEAGERTRSEVGTVQGGSISPLLANIYPHYGFDLWAQRLRKTRARGDVIIVRFADDFIAGFEHREEAEQFLTDLRERFANYGVPMNGSSIVAFHQAVGRLWWRALKRRSQSHHLPWERMGRYIDRWLPPARICHPYPFDRLGVVTRGRSRMRQCRTSGSVEGVTSNRHLYSDCGSQGILTNPSMRRRAVR
jgi:hypothetical protein